MSYAIPAQTVAAGSPVLITAYNSGSSDVTESGLPFSKLHTVQVSGDAVTVEIKISNAPAYKLVATLDDAIENMNASNITAILLTCAVGTAQVTIGGS